MTENKRYFKHEWEEEYYIFDSQTISEKEFDEKVEYEDYQAFADSMQGDEVVNRLNELNDENQDLWKIIRIYRKLATCHNCDYHNYDWYDDGDEFEVCEKGNDMSYMICSEWEKL